jgi:hypothetical protein
VIFALALGGDRTDRARLLAQTGYMVLDRKAAEADWLQICPPVLTVRRRRRRRLWIGAAAVAGLTLVASGLVNHDGDGSSSPPQPSTTQTSRASAGTPTSAGLARADPIVVRPGVVGVDSTAGWLSGAGDWDLFARSDDALYRIELKSGRVTRTPVRALAGPGLVSLVAGPDQVLMTSTDNGPGVVIPDGQAARPLRGLLAQPGRLFPGPRGAVWLQSTAKDAASGPVELVDLDGRTKRATVPVGGSWVTTDGSENLLLTGAGGVYQTSLRTTRRLTTGTITAIGPHHFLVVGCDAHFRCSTYLFNRSTSRQRRLGVAAADGIDSGIVAPDGRHAAFLHWGNATPTTFVVRNLADGTAETVDGAPSSSLSGIAGSLVWSPDSRSLMVLADGRLTVLDTVTHRTTVPDLDLPVLRQIAIRDNAPKFN